MPSKVGIDAWADMGNAGWEWANLKPYFRKFHTLTMPSSANIEHLALENNYPVSQNTAGRIQASFPEILSNPLPKAWNETFENLGYGFKGDLTGGKALGAYSNPATVHPTARQRSYSVAYYEPIIGRSNLRVFTGALVRKILFAGNSSLKTATGVEYTHDSTTKTVTARKEVITAAGALQSPKILELSGIGSIDILKSHGIPAVIENPNVGENLQDHLISGMSFEVVDEVETVDDLGRRKPEALQAAMDEYMTKQSGPFSRAPVFSTSFMPVVELQSEEGRKEINELLEKYPSKQTDHASHRYARSIIQNSEEGSGMPFMYNAQGNWGGNTPAELVMALLPENYITISVLLLNPLSSGYVHVNSADPAKPPTIDTKYLDHPLDIEVLARHIRYLETTLVKTQPIASLLKPNGKRNTLYKPFESLEDVKEYIRKTAMSNWHLVGTCAMLPKEKGGVVDEKLLVYGTTNLRVVDASIMPSIPRCNTQTVVYAVAERAADLIKKDSDPTSTTAPTF